MLELPCANGSMEPTTFDPNLREKGLLSDLTFSKGQEKARAKTSLRLKYEAESRVGLQKLGGLEGLRHQLGLSQRQICQLLLVDPSAWTRWCKEESKTPPHVVRALEWYLALERKEPAFAEWREHFLKRESSLKALEDWRRQVERRVEQGQNNQETRTDDFQRLNDQIADLKTMNHELKAALEVKAASGIGWKLISLINVGFLIWLLVRSLW